MTIEQSELNIAARALNMLAMTPQELEQTMQAHKENPMFASQVIFLAARQMLAAKKQVGMV